MAFKICDIIQCDASRSSVFHKILVEVKEKSHILIKYLDFCLKIGLKD